MRVSVRGEDSGGCAVVGGVGVVEGVVVVVGIAVHLGFEIGGDEERGRECEAVGFLERGGV